MEKSVKKIKRRGEKRITVGIGSTSRSRKRNKIEKRRMRERKGRRGQESN